MKKRIILISTLVGILLMSGGVYHFINRSFQSTVSDEFLEMVTERTETTLTDKELDDYLNQIQMDISSLRNRKSFENLYFSIGKIVSMKGNYEESNNYLLNALNYTGKRVKPVDIHIYATLATNYLALGDIDQGYYYFNEANRLMYGIHHPKLQINLYRTFADALLQYTNHTSLPVYLLSEAIALSEDPYEEIELRQELAIFYALNNFWEFATSELLKALEISKIYEIQELELSILEQLGSLYFYNTQYKESMETLKAYFEHSNVQPDSTIVSIWLHNCYFLEGYDALEEQLTKMEEYTKSIDTQMVGSLFFAFQRAYFSLLEGHLEECESYFNLIENQMAEETFDPITTLMITKLKLDLEYRLGNPDIDYVTSYRELLDGYRQISPLHTLRDLAINDVLMTLLELDDYEAVYKYTTYIQKPFIPEMQAMSAILNTIQGNIPTGLHPIDARALTFLKIGGYVIAALVGGGLTYGIYRYSSYINLLNKKAKDSLILEPLTKTLTKKALYDLLEADLSDTAQYQFLLMDIDDFNQYNEKHGYLAGDKVLIEVAKLLRSYFPNAYISRHCGQHFIIVLKNYNEGELLKVISALLEEIRENKNISSKEEITCSMGISKGFLRNVLDIDDHISQATKKLQVSKERGKGFYTL